MKAGGAFFEVSEILKETKGKVIDTSSVYTPPNTQTQVLGSDNICTDFIGNNLQNNDSQGHQNTGWPCCIKNRLERRFYQRSEACSEGITA